MILNFYSHLSLAGPETAKGSLFLPDELAFSLKEKKKKKKNKNKDWNQKSSQLHSADKQLIFNEKFQHTQKKENGNSSSKIHLLLKLSANNKSDHFANGGMEYKDPLPYEVNCNCTINLQSLKF